MIKVKKEYIEKIPDWYKNTDAAYQMVLSDDIDGLVSTSIVASKTNWTTEYFYDFEGLYVSDEYLYYSDKSSTRVWLDIPYVYCSEMAFDNHVIMTNSDDVINPLMINPNILNGVTNENYYDKYAMSTALLVWSIFYGDVIPEQLDGKLALLAIDSAYKPFCHDNLGYFVKNLLFLNKLGLSQLDRFLSFHNTSDGYIAIAKEYNLCSKISVNADGYLETDIDTERLSDVLDIDVPLPQKHFNKIAEFEKHGREHPYGRPVTTINDEIATVAYVGRDVVKYSNFLRTC